MVKHDPETLVGKFLVNSLKNEDINDSGRSMVEMLGVLAIVGVLSVAGLQGYSAAMSKLRANELLNEASKLATLLAMKAASGQPVDDSVFGEYDPSSHATFQVSRDAASKKFSLTISDVPSEVCEQMQKMTEGSFIQMSGECDDTSSITLTFNDDLSKGSGGVDGSDGGNSSNDEEEEEIPEEPAVNENCTSPAAVDNPGDITNEQTVDGPCRCPENKPQWDSTKSECVVAETKGACATYNTNECGSGYYCRFKGVRSANNLPAIAGDSSGHPITFTDDRVQGTCTKITGGGQIKGHYYYTGETLDYFSAYSWCLGKGSSNLITHSTLNEIGGYTPNEVKPGFIDYNRDIYHGFCDNTTCLEKGTYWTGKVKLDGLNQPARDYALSMGDSYDYVDSENNPTNLFNDFIWTLCE